MARARRAPSPRASGRAVTVTELEPEPSTDDRVAQPARARGEAIDRLLERVEPAPASATHAQHRERPAAPSAPSPALRTATLVAVERDRIAIKWRGSREELEATLAEGVDRSLVADAMREREAVLVEQTPGGAPIIVAVLQTRRPRELKLTAEKITIEADQEILLRSGKSAVRLREDGDVELVGGRILAMSRGLFRLVGRVLRLN